MENPRHKRLNTLPKATHNTQLSQVSNPGSMAPEFMPLINIPKWSLLFHPLCQIIKFFKFHKDRDSYSQQHPQGPVHNRCSKKFCLLNEWNIPWPYPSYFLCLHSRPVFEHFILGFVAVSYKTANQVNWYKLLSHIFHNQSPSNVFQVFFPLLLN